MNHTEVITQIVYLQRLGAAVRQRENELRAKLADEAERALATGTVVQWRIPDVATAFAKATHEAVYVADPTAFLAWVDSRYPSEVSTVRLVRPAWEASFLGRVLVEHTDDRRVVVDPATGEVVPGLAVRRGGEFDGVSVRVKAAARDVFDALAADRLARLELEATTPVVLAEVSDG